MDVTKDKSEGSKQAKGDEDEAEGGTAAANNIEENVNIVDVIRNESEGSKQEKEKEDEKEGGTTEVDNIEGDADIVGDVKNVSMLVCFLAKSLLMGETVHVNVFHFGPTTGWNVCRVLWTMHPFALQAVMYLRISHTL